MFERERRRAYTIPPSKKSYGADCHSSHPETPYKSKKPECQCPRRPGGRGNASKGGFYCVWRSYGSIDKQTNMQIQMTEARSGRAFLDEASQVWNAKGDDLTGTFALMPQTELDGSEKVVSRAIRDHLPLAPKPNRRLSYTKL